MIRTAITQNKGLDDIIDKYIPQQLEEAKEIQVNAQYAGVSPLNLIIAKFELVIAELTGGKRYKNITELYDRTKEEFADAVAHPEDIAAFYRYCLVSPEIKGSIQEYPFNLLLPYICANLLIQHSYDAGFNGFTLDTELYKEATNEYPWKYFYQLRGTPGRLLQIRIKGSLGPECAHHLEHCDFTVEGNVDRDFGNSSSLSHFQITGSTAGICFNEARYCTIAIDSWEWVPLHHMTGCTFKTSDPKRVDWFFRHRPELLNKNNVVLRHRNGTERSIGKIGGRLRHWKYKIGRGL